MTNLKFNGISH